MICVLFFLKVPPIYYHIFLSTPHNGGRKLLVIRNKSVVASTIILDMLWKEGPQFLSNMSFLLYFLFATIATRLVISKTVVNNSGLSSVFEKLESHKDHQLTKNHFGKYERYAKDIIGMLLQ